MSDPRYVPRELFPNPSIFGKVEHRALEHGGDIPRELPVRARWIAAQLQWEIARHVRGYLASRHLEQSVFAERLGWRREKLTRILNGRAVLSSEDLFLLVFATGGNWPKIATAIGAEPPGAQLEALLNRKHTLVSMLREIDANVDLLRGDRQQRPSSSRAQDPRKR